LSLLLIFSFVIALYSIIYAFKQLDLESNTRSQKKDLKLKAKSKTKYKSQFLKSAKNIDLDL
jgi:hypothetical protein